MYMSIYYLSTCIECICLYIKTLCSGCPATVLLEGGGVALSGGVARLLCLYSGDPAGVRQVLWSRRGRGGGDPTPLGSYSVGGGALVGAALGGRGQLSASPGESRLTLQPLEPQDEACYTCQLHTFPQGRLQGSTCLVVYGRSQGGAY